MSKQILSTLLRRTTVRSALKIHLAQESPSISYHVNHKPSLHNRRYFFHVFRASAGKREARLEHETRETGESAEKPCLSASRVSVAPSLLCACHRMPLP